MPKRSLIGLARPATLLFVLLAAMVFAIAPAAWASPAQHDRDCKKSTVPCKEADVSISKSAKTVKNSDDFVFTIKVKNNSKIAAQNVVVTDVLSKYFKIESLSGPGCKKGRTVTCKIGTLGAGKSVTITLRVDIEPDNFRGSISNTATVSSSTKDPKTSNNKSTVTVRYKGDR
ncbi:MAG: DUF11 domain-containing protein [Kouleothrix sp.]|jgi:uncharacterized repeat protein (TIGR01451 family)|nr:DUF11 domain-containing protein [Kouleothrix sp.]